METFLIYLSLSFLTLWIVAFSYSMGTLLWIQFVHVIQHINYRLDEIGAHMSTFIQRLLFYLHLSR